MICRFCGKEYESNRDKYIRPNLCSNACASKEWRTLYPERFKESQKRYINNNKEFIRKIWVDWSKKNKEKLKIKGRIKIMKWYHNKNNSHKMCEIIFVNNHRDIFEEFLGNKCLVCGLDKIMFHHKRYDLSHLDLYEYSKCLVPLCRQCHKDVHSNKISLKSSNYKFQQ